MKQRLSGVIGVLAGLLALLTNAWLAASSFLTTRIEHEISRTVAALQPVLGRPSLGPTIVQHGPVAVSLWHRTVVIPDIVVSSQGIAAGTVTIASITAHDLHRSGDTLAAARVVVRDFRFSGQLSSIAPSNAASRSQVLLPAAMIEGVSYRAPSRDAALYQVAPQTLASQTLAGMHFAGLTVKSVNIPELKASTTLQSKTLIAQTYNDIKVNAVRDGKIGVVSAGHATITTTLLGEHPQVVEINDANFADVDIGLVAGLYEGAAPPTSADDRHKTVLRYGSTGATTLYRDGAVVATCASIEVSNIGVDASRSGTAVRTLQAAQAGVGQRLSRKQEQAMQDAVVTLYENVAADWFKINALTWAPGALPVGRGQGSIASLQIHDLIDGKLARLQITGLDAIAFAETPTFSPSHDSLVVGRSTLHKLNLVELTRLPARLLTSSMKLPSAAILWPLAIRLFEGIDAEQVLITTGVQPDGIGIDQLSANWGLVIGQTPTSGQLRARFTVPQTSGFSLSNWLPTTASSRADASSHARIHANVDGRWVWREDANTLDVGPIDVALADIGSVNARVRLSNVTRMALVSRPDLLPAAIQAITLGAVDVTMQDQGLIAQMGNGPSATEQRQRTVTLVQTLVGVENRSRDLSDVAVPISGWTAIASDVGQFMARPGGRLTVSLTPTTRLSIGNLLSSGKSGGDLLRFLALQIDARAALK
jgi:hypothetical protein